MNREVGRFLIETWQLFYWSLFFPSKLQQRMNEWHPTDKDTSAYDMLTGKYNVRLLLQYLLISVILSLLLAVVVALSDEWSKMDWLILIAPLISCFLGIFFIPSGIGFCIPFLLVFSHWFKADHLTKAVWDVFNNTPPISQLLAGNIFVFGSVTTIIIVLVQRERKSLSFNRYVIWICGGLTVMSGVWLASQNWQFTIFLSVSTSISIAVLLDLTPSSYDTNSMQPDIGITGVSLFSTFLMLIVVETGVSICVITGVENSVTICISIGISICLAVCNGILFGVQRGFNSSVATGVTLGVATSVATFMIFLLATSIIFLAVTTLVSGNLTSMPTIFFVVIASAVLFAVYLYSDSRIVGVISGTAIIVLIGITVGLIIIMININAPKHWFLIVCALVAFCCSSSEEKLLAVWLSTIFITIGWTELSFNALWAIPVTAISYYRILPDYLLFYPASFLYSQRLLKQPSLNSFKLLSKLPPYTTELLWLPLPNHSQILTDTFRQDSTLGLAAFQKIQSISLPGFQLTLQKALPSIVADQFAAVKTNAELIDSFRLSHPILPFIIPAFYQSDKSDFSLVSSKSRNSEINILFPLLKEIAENTTAALQAGSSALRERGLERLVNQLKILPTQLPGLGLKPQAVKRWQPAIERWQHILELEIAEQQKTSQGELLNPFQWGNPIQPDRAAIFKGRQDFADRLVRLILDRNRPTLVLHGPRRAGKTSFLLNLPRLLPSDLVPIYLDMQQGSMTHSEGDFCYGLVRAIDRDTRSQGLQLPPIHSRQDFATQPYPTLEDWLDLALPKLGERRLLLNLDEFEKIGSAIKDGRISDRLFDQLRSMIQHYDRLGFLFSGVQTLDELGPRWSNYFISVVPMEMHYLEPHEAEDLLLHPDPEFTLRYDTGIIAEILRLTRCQPYLLQLIGSAIVNQANLQHTQLATTALLQAAIQSAFTNGEPYFTNIWTEFTGNKDNPAEVTAGQQILIALAQGNSHVETNDETTAARRRLLRYHVIERDGDIDKIEIPLFEQWVRERAIET
jgi:hypothetical protein